METKPTNVKGLTFTYKQFATMKSVLKGSGYICIPTGTPKFFRELEKHNLRKNGNHKAYKMCKVFSTDNPEIRQQTRMAVYD